MCFPNNLNPVVISKDLYDNNWDLTKTSLIVIDSKFKKQITGFLPSYPTYVLSFESIDNLNMVIKNLQGSTLWNIKSRFLILATDLRCISTRRILEFMWKRDLLSVYYLCSKKKSTVVFTLNPYASYAPEPWALIEKFGDNDKKMTLYSLQYSKDPEICKSINFDKTDHLEGENIKSILTLEVKPLPKFNYQKNADKFLKRILKIETLTTLPYKISVLINATPTLDFIYTPNLTEYWKQGYMQQLVDCTHDIYDHRMEISKTNYEYVDIITDYSNIIEYSILTKKTDFLTVISNVANDVLFVAGAFVLLVMFAITMVLINRDDVRQALMDVMRLTTSMGLESPLTRLAMKFIFFFGFLFAFLIVPDLQGHMSAILSKPLGRNVETLKDLYQNKFHVFYPNILEDDMINEQLWVSDAEKKYLHSMTREEMGVCWIKTMKNSTIACIFETDYLLSIVSQYNDLFLSKRTVFSKQYVYWARKNWPLKSKFDKMTWKVVESGIIDSYYSNMLNERISKKIRAKNKIRESGNYEEFDYDDLIFNYYFFGFLATFGIMVFMIETICARYSRIYRQFLIRGRN